MLIAPLWDDDFAGFVWWKLGWENDVDELDMIIDMTLTLWMVTSCIIVARTDRATINGKKKRCEQRGPTSSWPIGSDET